MEIMSWMPWVIGAMIVCSFLYRTVWPYLRKVGGGFRGIRLNSQSGLSEEEYKKLCVGSFYAAEQNGYLNSLTLDIKSSLPTILGEWWGISNSREAKETLDGLCKKGAVDYFPFIYQAFLLTEEKEQYALLQRSMPTQGDYEIACNQLQNLKTSFQPLVDCGTIRLKEDLLCYGVAGWDANRINFVARACYDMGYISEAEAWEYIEKAYSMARTHFISWRYLAMSYVVGRAIWGGADADIREIKSVADELLAKPNSPWVQIEW